MTETTQWDGAKLTLSVEEVLALIRNIGVTVAQTQTYQFGADDYIKAAERIIYLAKSLPGVGA